MSVLVEGGLIVSALILLETLATGVARQQSCVPHPARRFAYIIRSENEPERRYVGLTANPATRLAAHNAGLNVSTAR